MKTITLILILILSGCSDRNETDIKLEPKHVDSFEILKPYSKATNIYGSTFGSFFQTLYRNNNYELMLDFTSKKSKQHYGIESIINYYKNDFEFDYNLGKLTNVLQSQDTIQLTYANSSIYGTRRKTVIFCTLEDSIKLLLTKLDSPLFN